MCHDLMLLDKMLLPLLDGSLQVDLVNIIAPNVPLLLLDISYTAKQAKCPTRFVGLMPVPQRLWEVYTLTNHAGWSLLGEDLRWLLQGA